MQKEANIYTSRAGLTLMEVLVSMAILVSVMLYIGDFMVTILDFQSYLSPTFETQQELQATVTDMSIHLRTMNYSSLGGYPIASVGTSSITFFTDADSDGLYEQIRYFLTGNTMKKGVLKPTGNPLVYNAANEVTYDVIHNIVSTSSIFSFYNSSYTGTEAPMTYPIDISQIKVIGVSIASQRADQETPIYASVKATPRNITITF